MNDREALAWNIPGGKRASFENTFENFFHPEGETVGLGSAFDFRFTKTGAEKGGELAETVEALVVHFDDDDTVKFREDFFEAVRQWVDVPQMRARRLFAIFARQFHRIVDGPVSGTPADEQRATLLIAIDLGHLDFFGELRNLLRRFAVMAMCNLAGPVAHLVVLESGTSGIFPVDHRRAGRRMLRDLINCVGLEARGTRRKMSFGSIIRSFSSGCGTLRVAREVSLKIKTGVLYLRAMRAASIAM